MNMDRLLQSVKKHEGYRNNRIKLIMATYKEVKGVTIQTLDADPVLNVGSWSAGGSLNAGRRGIAGAGTQTAALAAGGGAVLKS